MMTLSVISTLALFALISCREFSVISSFQMTMVSPTFKRVPPLATPSGASAPSIIRSTSGVKSALISNLAVFALKLRLEDQKEVKCLVDAAPTEMIRGRLGKVTVAGKEWRSPLGLSCRAIEASVTKCEVDIGKVIRMRKLKLLVPAKGDAMISMNGEDFGNFLTHPLLKSPQYEYLGELQDFQFLKEGALIDPTNKSVEFYGIFMGEKWKCTMNRAKNGGANIVVSPTNLSSRMLNEETVPPMSIELSNVVTGFFTSLVFDLDGVILSFQDMMITSKGRLPSVLLALKITVKKFPSTGLAF